MQPKYHFGQQLWFAHTEQRPITTPCPECLGGLFLTVILGDESRVTIECGCCRRGYRGPLGVLEGFEHVSCVKVFTVTGFEISGGEFEYRSQSEGNGYWLRMESELFTEECAAAVRAQELAVERSADEQRRMHAKQNDKKSWAWNVSYHRKAIRDAEASLKHHRKMLEFASEARKAEASA